MTNVLTLFVLKLTLLLALGAALAALLRGRSAATRHFVWAMTLCSAVVLAIVAFAAPPLRLTIPDWREPARAASTAGFQPAPAQGRLAAGGTPTLTVATAPAASVTPSVGSILAGIWLTGFAALLVWSLAGHAAVRRIARRAAPADGDHWTALIDEALQRIGVTGPVRVALSDVVAAPFTSGWLRPIVLLPADASSWPADRRRAALLHELAHVARNDYLVHLVAGFACALYWFHPVAWLALRRLRRESEQATDDRVIARGMFAPEYATHLLDVARAARERGFADRLVVGMACPSHLETRLRALLDETRTRSTVSRTRAMVSTAGVALLVVPLAIAQPELRASRVESPKPHASFQRTVDAAPGGTLVLDLQTGATVEVIGGDEPRVNVSAVLRGRDAGATVVDAVSAGNEVHVTSRLQQRAGSSSTSHAFVVHVPRRFNVRLDSAGGDLSIAGVEGTFEGTTGGGSIELTRLHGRAELSTGGGSIDVTDSDLEGSVSTGGGTVRFARVLGGLRGTSGSGPAVRTNMKDLTDLIDLPGEASGVDRSGTTSDGMMEISKAGGNVDLDEAPHGAAITTGGGRITVGRAAGLVEVSTGGGRIEIGPVAGSVRAGTGAGNVDITLLDAGGQEQTVDVTTGKGNVVVELPAGFDGRFEIETAYTESHGPVSIDSAWSLQHEPVTDWDARQGTPRRYVRARGSAGSGRGLVRIRAVNGNVRLRRTSSH